MIRATLSRYACPSALMCVRRDYAGSSGYCSAARVVWCGNIHALITPSFSQITCVLAIPSARILLRTQHRQNACGGRFRVTGRTGNGGNKVWRFNTGAANPASRICASTDVSGLPLHTQWFLPGIPDHALLFSNQPWFSLLPVATIFYQPGWRYIRAVWYFGRLQLRFTLTTIWYSVMCPFMTRISGVAITPPACRAQLELAALRNSQVAANIHRPGSTLHRKTYISPVSRSEVWRTTG